MKTTVKILQILITVFIVAATAASAAIIEKADNTEPLNSPDSWVGGIVPGPGDLALWGQTAGIYDTGGDVSFSGIAFTNFNVANTSIRNNTLTLGKDGIFINRIGGANRQFDINCLISLATNQIWDTLCSNFIVNNQVNMNGNTLTLAGTGKQFKGSFNGNGTVSVESSSMKLTNQGTKMSNVDVILKNGNFTVDKDVVAAQTLPLMNSLALSAGSTVDITSSSKNHPTITNTTFFGVHSDPGGGIAFPWVKVQAQSNYRTVFNSGAFYRASGAAALWVRGNMLGWHDPAALTPASVNVMFDTPPALFGSGAPGTPSIGLIRGMVASTNTADNAGIGLATYDAVKGVRLLDFNTEYTSGIVDGEDAGNNVRITNVAVAGSATRTTTILQDTAVNSLSLVTSGTGANGGIVIDAEPNAALKIESGVIFASLAVNSPSSDKSSMVYLRAPIDLNGQQGLVVHGKTTGGMSGGSGNGLLEMAGEIFNDGGLGVVFTGPNNGATHFNGSASAYTGPTIISGGLVRFIGEIPGSVIVNGGTLQVNGCLPDWADMMVNGGDCDHYSTGETFNTLRLAGGTYSCNGNAATVVMTNAWASGGTWNIDRSDTVRVLQDAVLSGAVLNAKGGDANNKRAGAVFEVSGRLIITNILHGVYQPVLFGAHTNPQNEPYIILKNPAAGFFCVGNAENDNTVLITADLPVATVAKRGAILLNGAYPFEIDDGAAEIDLRINANISDDDTTPGALIKRGTGTLELTQTNSCTLATSVEEGRLFLNDAGCITASVEVSGGALFGGNGAVQGDITLADNAGLALSIASPLVVEGDVTAAGVVNVTLLDAIPENEAHFQLATAAAISGEFSLSPELQARWHVAKVKNNTELWLLKNTSTLFLIR